MNTVGIFEIAALFAGLLTFTYFSNRVFGWMVGFLGYTVINEWVAFFYSRSFRKTNLAFYNVFSIVEIVFFLVILYVIIKKEQIRKYILIGSGLYFFSSFFEILVVFGWHKYHFISMSFGCLLIFIFSCLYFFELLKEDVKGELLFYPLFWLVSAILFFHLLLLIYILNHYFFPAAQVQSINKMILQVTNVVFYSFVIIAFLCHLRKARPLNW
jgi:hypothetical protein